jgi:hypothetical protein
MGGGGGNAGASGAGGAAGVAGNAGAVGGGAHGGDGGNGGLGGSGGPVGSSGVNGSGGLGGTGVVDGVDGTPLVEHATVAIQTFILNGFRPYPIVNISINGGPMHPVLVDSGSSGLVIDYVPTGLGSKVYSGGPFTYGSSSVLYYDTYDTTVSFGNGIVTAPTAVNVLTPSSANTFQQYWAGLPIDGVWGLGPNNGYPGTSTVVSALLGTLNQGVLIDGSTNQITFGPNGQSGVSVAGAPSASLLVQINNGPKVPVSGAYIDSGYQNGYIGSSIYTGPTTQTGNVPAGTRITVYTADGTVLYSYTTTSKNGPFVTSGSDFNTGYTPYLLAPIYTGQGPSGYGTTVFDN